MIQSTLRQGLRWFCQHVPIRGRHRLADQLGLRLAPAQPMPLVINGLPILLDHQVRTCRFMYYGMYETHVVNFLRRALRLGDTVIEPGANIGYLTATMAGLVGPAGKIIALEPSQNCLQQLQAAVEGANLPQVELLPYALADRAATLVFHDTPRAVAKGYATLDVVHKPADSTAHEVPAVSVDELMAQYQLGQVRFLKLDIEGSELLALQGASEALRDQAIDYILVETTFRPDRVDFNRAIIDLLQAHHYRSHLLTPQGRLSPCTLDPTTDFREDVIWVSPSVSSVS